MTGGSRFVGIVGALAVVLVAGCAGSGTSGSDASSVLTTVPHTGPADDLAASQLTAETAPPPATPPPCAARDVSVWTAQVLPGDGTADAVLRIRNDGDEWCEVDVSASPRIDPAIEPDVWLEPGTWADLLVGSSTEGCDGPSVVAVAQVDLNGVLVDVETAAVVACRWWLTAFYPNDVSTDVCERIDVATTAGAVLIRNGDVEPCRLGALVSVAGDGATAMAVEPGLAVPVLAGGDVVAFELAERGDGCAPRPVELVFDSGATTQVTLSGCSVTVGSGSPQPWIGGPGSPAADDPAALLSALDAF